MTLLAIADLFVIVVHVCKLKEVEASKEKRIGDVEYNDDCEIPIV